MGEQGDTAVAVSEANPLPVQMTPQPASTQPLAQTLSASGSVGPFAPDLNRAIWLTLSGSWSGTATIMRSVDHGATRYPLTLAGQPWAVFTANAQEVISEESDASATYYVDIALNSGSVAVRVSQ